MISLGCVTINEQVKENVLKALEEESIGQGRFIDEFQSKLRTYFNVRHAFFVANGTLGDAVALASLKNLKPDKTEVIVPALTFVAQVNAIKMAGLKPVFVDVGDRLFNINYNKIQEKITDKTLAIMPTHLLGIPASMDIINDIAYSYDLFVVEDSCEAFGSKYKGRLTGTWGDVGVFSFYVSHTVTTGEGGLIITNNDDIAETVKSVMNHGRKSNYILDKFKFPRFGFNAKATNLQAAIGSVVIDEADNIIETRRKNVEYLNKSRNNFDYRDDVHSFISPHCYPIKAESRILRDRKILDLEIAEIEARPLYNALPNNSYLANGEFYPNALAIAKNYYYVPVHQNLSIENLDYIVEKINE